MFSSDFIEILFENDFKAVMPELFLLTSAIILIVFGVISSTSASKGYPLLANNINKIALFSFFIAFLIICYMPLSNGSIFYNSLVHNDFTFYLRTMLIVGAAFSLCISLNYIEYAQINFFELAILMLLSVSSMLFLISATDFISMYLAIEMQSLCFYVMAALKRNSQFSSEAGLKYFLLGAFSSGLVIFGCSIIYGFTGCTEFSQIGKIFECGNVGSYSVTGCELGMIFILVGILFKCTGAPFHMWAPDVYQGAPTAVTAFFSIAPKIANFAFLVRLFLSTFYSWIFPWQKILIFSSIASMLIGTLAAMCQNNLKRLLAYSSIGHVGYLLVGICCASLEGIQALLIYLFVYIVITINLFTIVMLHLSRQNTQTNKYTHLLYTLDLTQLASTNPLLAISLALTMFSIAGIPPLAGFYSKAALFFSALSSCQYILALFGILTSVVSCFYYIRLVKIMYFEKSPLWCTFNSIPKSSSLPLAFTNLFMVSFLIYPNPLNMLAEKCALALTSSSFMG